MALFKSLDEVVCIVVAVVVNAVGRVVRVDLVDILSQLLAWGSVNVLDLLETTALHECSLCLKVLGKNLGELGADICQDVVGGKLEKGL